MPFWFEKLLEDTVYQNTLKCRWEYLRETSFHQDAIFNFIDSLALYLNDAQQRNFQRWNILGSYVWPNYYVGNSYEDEIYFLKNWISDRLIWMDNNIPSCSSNGQVVFNPQLEKVVDVLGRETKEIKNIPLFYIYYPGNVQKRIIVK